MLLFKRISLLTTAAVYFLIFVGGLVRVSGAGLGCPDWPKCFGRWIPPLSIGQLPADIDPAQFNFTLAWIEYVNRLIGVGVGLLVLLAAILAIRHGRRHVGIVGPAVAAAILIAFQGWQGSVVVASELEPFIVTLHMLLAFVIAGLMVVVTFRAYALDTPGSAATRPAGTLQLWLLLLWAVTVVQVLLGTQVREALEFAAIRFPLYSDLQLLSESGTAGLLHAPLGVGLAVLLGLGGAVILMRRQQLRALAAQAAWTMIALGVLEVVIGGLIWSVGLHPVLQVMHLWVAAILAGVVLVAFLAVRYLGADAADPRAYRPRLLGVVVTGMIVLGVLASVVTSRADFARRQLPVLGEVPEFTFVSQSGEPWGRGHLDGKITVAYFGFASCQGPCPVMNGHVAAMYKLYDGDDRVQFAKVSVDPGRDTLAALQAFAQGLGVNDRRWVFLRAPIDSVVWLSERGFMMAAENLPMGHSTKLVLVDRRGRIRGYYSGTDEVSINLLKANIRELVRAET
jgi:cytochrome c oxidase assembly protein subunit 15